jgi:hypothetical protein
MTAERQCDQSLSSLLTSACAPDQAESEIWRHIKMNRSKLMRRLSVVAALAIVLALAAGAPTLQAQPEAGTISTGAGVQVWNGHNCPANVPVSIASLSAGLGGYETKVGWDPARFSSADADIAVGIGVYLTNGGTRQQTGDGSTPPLKAVSSGAVKFGAYSWGTNNPPGNAANGQLATVAIKPTATCGAAALTLTETQLVDINGLLIGLTAQTGSSVSVFSRFDTSGGGPLINSGDVNAVLAKLNQAVGGACGPNYRYDTSLGGPLINSGDVNAVLAKLNQPVGSVCVN